MKHEKTIAEIIEDLEAIKVFFMEQNNGCYPVALEEAINILKQYGKE